MRQTRPIPVSCRLGISLIATTIFTQGSVPYPLDYFKVRVSRLIRGCTDSILHTLHPTDRTHEVATADCYDLGAHTPQGRVSTCPELDTLSTFAPCKKEDVQSSARRSRPMLSPCGQAQHLHSWFCTPCSLAERSHYQHLYLDEDKYQISDGCTSFRDQHEIMSRCRHHHRAES